MRERIAEVDPPNHLESFIQQLRQSLRTRSQLRANVLSSLGTAVLSTLLIGIAYPVYLHFLGYQQYGLWLVLSTVLVMAQLGNLGISPALVKLIAEDFASGDVDGVYRYLACGVITLLISGFALCAGVMLLRHSLIALFGIAGQEAVLAYRLLPYIGILCASALVSDALNAAVAGLGRYDLVSYSQLASQMLTVVVAIILFKLGYGVWGLLIANGMASFFLTVVSLALIRRITRSEKWVRFDWDRQRLRRILHFGSWVFGASIVNTIFNPLNKLLVTHFAGIAAVPVYDIAYATCFKVRSLFESGFRSLTPALSSLNAVDPRQARAQLAETERQGSKVILYAGTLLYLAVFALCGWGLRIWLRGRFTADLPLVFRIMLVGSYLSLWGVQSWFSLLGFGRSPQILFANLAMVVTNIGFVFAWPLFQPEPPTLAGITAGTSAGLLASTLYLRWQGARLRGGHATRNPSTIPTIATTAHTATNQSPQRV